LGSPVEKIVPFRGAELNIWHLVLQGEKEEAEFSHSNWSKKGGISIAPHPNLKTWYRYWGQVNRA
jgi:hypothetical protein